MPAKDKLQQPQREAFVDLLLWIMFIDRKIDFTEHDQIDDEISRLHWENPMPLDQYHHARVPYLRDLLTNETAAIDFLADISRRLRHTDARQWAYDACLRVAGSDHEVAESEQQFLDQVRATFKLG